MILALNSSFGGCFDFEVGGVKEWTYRLIELIVWWI